ncbi:MAG: hypothetical protein ACD_62C00666G0003 [uncultured bacterium]|nr:MAG: hypothetical protein ACD_62C00666G0003 [uncultured bacterium]HLD45966.1 hypothetical protein [bacterium]
MDDVTLIKTLIEAANKQSENILTLTCQRAHQLAEEYSIELRRIGAICQTEGIKIINCELGCFGKHRHE